MTASPKRSWDYGFTMAEVVVSMVIMAVCLIPMMSMFSQSRYSSGRAGKNIEAVNLAQTIMEDLKQFKGKSIKDIAFIPVADYSSKMLIDYPEGKFTDLQEEFGRFQFSISKSDAPDTEGLYEISVTVKALDNVNEKAVQLVTYLGNRSGD